MHSNRCLILWQPKLMNKKIIEIMFANLTYKQLFLIDAIGAIITAFLLSQLLGNFVSVFGMPTDILYPLAGIAAFFALYSYACYLWVTKDWRLFLKGIATANTIYCLLTLGLVIYRWESLTWWGIAYFIGEIIVVMSLVSVEWKKSNIRS